jgi:elongation factor P
MGRGGATYNFKCVNIITGANNTYTYKSGTMLEGADVGKMSAEFLYAAGDSYSFMENDTGEIHDIDVDIIEAETPYLKEGLNVFLTKYNDNVIGIELPAVVNYTIASTLPGDRGNRSTGGTKEATLDNGMVVQVPLHAKEGDTIGVNTDSGKAS